MTAARGRRGLALASGSCRTCCATSPTSTRRVTLLGRPAARAVGVAPTTLQRAVHPDGELAMARATAAAGSVMVVSSNAGTPFADIAATGVRWWLQAYLPADRTLAEPMLDRAVAAGAEAVVLTVDTPVVATQVRRRGQRLGRRRPGDGPGQLRPRVRRAARRREGARPRSRTTSAGWPSRTGLPVVVKGVLRPDDARRCVQAGAAAVWVSNHGGRQLDRAAATAECLPDVRRRGRGRAEVYVDGGVRSGLDVLAALALGADAVFLGRLPLLALVDGRGRGGGAAPRAAGADAWRRCGWPAAGPSPTPASIVRSRG